jgi:flagellar hook-basal body complex protein FliE
MRIPPIDLNQAAKSIASVQEIAPDIKTAPSLQASIPGAIGGGDPSASFSQAIKKAVGEVSNLSNEADKLAVNLASGNVEDVHKAMMAMQKAKLALDFTIQVRNKVIEAYQEIMRMQV